MRTGYNQTCPSVHLGSDPVKGSYSWDGGSRGKGGYFYHEDQENTEAERALKKNYVCVSMHVYAAFHMPSIQETQKMGTKSPGIEVGW